jgi:Kdo2-lipid IVA lauroyltransferase/acyltransferase
MPSHSWPIKYPLPATGATGCGFLESPTAFYPGPAQIVCATGYATFFAATRRVSRGHYEILFERIGLAQQQLDVQAFTACYARLLEAQILADPPSWLWSHRRWKLAPPVVLSDLRALDSTLAS